MLHYICTVMNVIYKANQQSGFLIWVEVGKIITEMHQTSRGFWGLNFGFCFVSFIIIKVSNRFLGKIPVDQLTQFNLNAYELWIILK